MIITIQKISIHNIIIYNIIIGGIFYEIKKSKPINIKKKNNFNWNFPDINKIISINKKINDNDIKEIINENNFEPIFQLEM